MYCKLQGCIPSSTSWMTRTWPLGLSINRQRQLDDCKIQAAPLFDSGGLPCTGLRSRILGLCCSLSRNRSMSHRTRIFALLALTLPLLEPVTMAQKPPAPATPTAPTPPPQPTRPANSLPPGSAPCQPTGDLVMFLRGRVATNDGTTV